MAEGVTVTPEPSTGAGNPGVLGALSSGQRDHWRMTGELPSTESAVESKETPAIPLTDADSSPAEPAAQAASTDATAPPASEPGTPKKHNAETRIKELLEANKRLQQELEARQSASRPTAPSDAKVDSSPTTQPVSLESVIRQPDLTQPPMLEDAFYQAFPDASVRDYLRYTSRYEALAVHAEQERAASVRQRESQYVDTLSQIDKAAPDLVHRLPAALVQGLRQPLDLMPEGMAHGPWNVAAYEILNSEKAQALLTHFADHPEDVAKIHNSRSQRDTIRIVTQIEARLESSPVSPPAPAGNPVSLAPPPPATLGKKPGQPADELQEAIKTGDFARYRELQNRKELKHA